MSSVKLTRRWGSHEADSTVEVDDTMAAWLVTNCYAETEDRPGTARAGVLAPGTDGADLRAGGDVSRPGHPQVQRSSRYNGEPGDSDENYANRAARVAGAPRAGGVQKVDPAQASDTGARKASGEQKATSEQGDSDAADTKSSRGASGKSRDAGK